MRSCAKFGLQYIDTNVQKLINFCQITRHVESYPAVDKTQPHTMYTLTFVRTFVQGLVCIIPGEVGVSERSLPADNPAQPRSQPPLKTVRLWQRLKGSQWVIGAVVKNHSLE